MPEAQAVGIIDVDEISTLGDVVCGRGPRSPSHRRVFDSSDTVIQDLAVCAVAVARAIGAA